MLLNETSNRVVLTDVTFVVPQAYKYPHPRVPLLRRSRFVQLQDLQNPIMKQSQLRSRLKSPLSVLRRLRLTAVQNRSNLVPRMMKFSSHLANAHAIAMSSPNSSTVSILDPRNRWQIRQYLRESYTVGPVYAPIRPPKWGRFARRSPATSAC
jgi:hypothetical protein